MISERDKTKPLFLYVAFNAPHGPCKLRPNPSLHTIPFKIRVGGPMQRW